MNGTDRPSPGPGLLLLLGALAVIGSGLLDWYTVTGPGGTVDGTGFGSSSGIFSAIVAGVLVLFATMILLGVARRGLSIAAIVISAFLLILTAIAAFAPELAITSFEAADFADEAGISVDEARSQLEALFESGTLSGTAQVGTYVAAGGALLALIASIWGTASYKRRAGAVPPAPPAYYQTQQMAPPPAAAPPVAPPPAAPPPTPPPAGPPPAPPSP